METIELNTIQKEITVAATQQTAFEVFVNQMGYWWGQDYSTEDISWSKWFYGTFYRYRGQPHRPSFDKIS